MANRYDNGSVSNFNPLSYQELAITPTMMRQKHDASIAQAEAMRIKADPLDVHLNRAVELKKQIDDEIAKNVDTLNKEGYNPTTFQNITKLNRQYQDMISPTGEIGKINAAKQVYAKNFNDYLEDATKNKGWSRERALANWNIFSNQYTGYNEGEISNIGQLGAPKKVEVMDVLKDVHGLLGEQVVGEMKASGYSFNPGPDGSMVMVDSKGRRIETSNKPNLQAAQNLINQKLVGKEWQDSIKFEGENTKNIYDQLTSGINAMLTNKVVDNRSQDAQYIAPKISETPPVLPGTVFGEDYNTKTIGAESTSYKDLDKIGTRVSTTTTYGSPLTMGTTGTTISQKGGVFSHKNISDPYLKARYIAVYNRMNKTGMFTGTKGADDPKVSALVKAELQKQGPITLTSKLLTTDKDLDNSGFGSTMGKTADERDKQIRKELQMSNSGARKLIGKDGKEYTFSEAMKEFDLEGINGVTYQGYLSPLNWEEDSFKGTNSKASPHIITVAKKDGTGYEEFKTSRTNTDNKNININRYNDLQKNYKKSTVNPNEWNKFDSESESLNKLQLKYNTKNPKFDPQRGVLNYEIMDSKGQIHALNESEYITTINVTR